MIPAANPLASLVGYQLRRVSAPAMEELARNLAELNLRPTEASILLLVGANASIRPSEVGRSLGVQRANMTPLVAGLEQRGFLARTPIDGRSFGLNLTHLGQDICTAADRVMQDHDARMLRSLTSREVKLLSGLLSKMLDAAADDAQSI